MAVSYVFIHYWKELTVVKARGPSKGANWLARERGLVRPRFTTSCAQLFAEKGDPWLTNTEQNNEYPLNRSREAETLSALEQQRLDIYEKARAKLEELGVSVPPGFKPVIRPSLVVDPDLDCFTKATRVEARQPYVDPKGKPIVKDHARWRANLLRKTRIAMAAVSIEVKDKPRKKAKVKGGFYVFDAPVNEKGKRRR